MFVGREKEIKLINEKINSDGFEFGILYGRRRIGKTRLLAEVIKNNDVIYYSASEMGGYNNLMALTSVVTDYFKDPVMFPNFSMLFEYVAKHTGDKHLLFVIDEFTYLLNNNEGLLSVLQNAIDAFFKKTKITLIISGSHIGMMEDAVSYHKPLYARSTFKIHLKPFDYYEASEFYKNYSSIEKIRTYSVFGGIPFYLEKIDSVKSLEHNIMDLVIGSGAVFENEIYFFLQQEVRAVASYGAILNAVASGATKLNEISTKSKVDNTGTTSKYIETLINLGIMEKEICFGEKFNSRKTIYRITDNFFHFYFEFIEFNKSKMMVLPKEIFYNKFIAPDIDGFISLKYETIAREYLIRTNLQLDKEEHFYEIGRYWYNDAKQKKNIEIDIVTRSEAGVSVYECKWTNDVFRLDTVKQLKKKSIVLNPVKFGGFSKSGYSEEAHNELEIAIEPEDLFRATHSGKRKVKEK